MSKVQEQAYAVLPTSKLDAHSSTRHTFAGIALRFGDEIRLVGTPNSGEQAVIDYLEIKQAANGS